MSDELRELSALSALGALSAEDHARFAALAGEHPQLADDLARDQQVAARIATVLASHEAPPLGLGGRILAAARSNEPSVLPAPVPASARDPWWKRLVPTLGVAAASAAAAVAITLVATRDPGPGTPTLEASIVPHSAKDPVSGRVALYRPDATDGRIMIDLSAFPAASAGHHYQVWVLKKGSTVMEAIGTFNVSAKTTHIEARLPSRGEYSAVDISLEEDNGPPEHSGTSVAGATFGTA